MKIYGVQADLQWEDKDANFIKIRTLLDKEKIQAESLIVLPETFSTGFSMNLKVTTRNEPNQTESFLSDLAREKKCWVTAGLIEPNKTGNKGVNRSVSFSPSGERIYSYAKTHPASIYEEEKFHEPGNTIGLFPMGSFKACPLICYDLRFPELFRIGMQMGANLFIVIACWPKARIDHWVSLLKARAIENQAYVVGVNRAGADSETEFGGRSLFIDPMGKFLADAGTGESVTHAELDLNRLNAWREKFPVLKHARPAFPPVIR